METSPTESVSIQARRVLVPVANPSTTPGLLRLASKLAAEDNGRILALFVTVSGQETDNAAFEAVDNIVNEAVASGMPVELITRTAPSAARGILDSAREFNVSVMVLGFQAPSQGKIELGSVVESVARTTPCDLLVFRNPSRSAVNLEDVKHVMLPLDGSDNSKVAARLGVALAEAYDVQVNAIYVQTDPDLPSWFGLARIEASLVGLKDTRKIQRQVVRASDLVNGVLSRCDRSDMIVLGYSGKSSLDRWIFGSVAQRMLAQAPGPVILAKRAESETLTPSQRMRRRLFIRISPTLTPSERTEVLRQATEQSLPGINFVVLMIISSLLASFGLLQNSAAVIIGAMLVAPLMSPLVSFSVGMIQGRLPLMRTAAITTGTGVLIGLFMALLLGLVLPFDVATPEMLARGEPTLLDLGVALASGAVGAFATARRDIPAALAGVAIAAALVPPLCTVGLALAIADWELATGSGLLFLTNIVGISLIGALIFAWLGLRPRRDNETIQPLAITLGVLLLLAVPLASAFIDVVQSSRDTAEARQVLEREFADAEVIEVEVHDDQVTATIRSTTWITNDQALAAETALEDDLGYDIDLEITNWLLVKPPSEPEPEPEAQPETLPER